MRLSPARKMVCEILHHGRKVPAIPLAKRMRLGELAEARKAGARVSWTAIFMRAYALVAQEHAELRRAYISWPRPRLYEHPSSTCALILEREHQGENIVLGARIRCPEAFDLVALDEYLRLLREAPVEKVSHFRQWLRVGRMPGLLRRFLFWSTLNLSGAKRAKRLGTFAISSLGNFGIEQHHPISPLTTYLTFGPISRHGHVNVKIIYDHRVMDGRTVARSLVALERVLTTRLLDELCELLPGAHALRERKGRQPAAERGAGDPAA